MGGAIPPRHLQDELLEHMDPSSLGAHCGLQSTPVLKVALIQAAVPSSSPGIQLHFGQYRITKK